MSAATSGSAGIEATTLAVVAGGAGLRMGKPKALLRVGGQPILAWLLDRLAWPGPTMLVTAPSVIDPAGDERFDIRAVDPCDGQGPLRGILTAIENVDTATMVVIPVDMPYVDWGHLRWVHDALIRTPGAAGTMFRVRRTGQIEPFPSAFRSTAKGAIARRIASNQLAIHQLCDDREFATVDAPDNWPDDVWTNLNDPASFKLFESAIGNTLSRESK
jgi:molybdopterin-guanine dinucleotide biosynthesis protein A